MMELNFIYFLIQTSFLDSRGVGVENKKFSPVKVGNIWHLQIDTFQTQKVEVHDLNSKNRFFWQKQK